MNVSVIIVAAGKGERFGSKEIPKAFYPLIKKPLLAYALWAFESVKEVQEIIVAVLPEMMDKSWQETMGGFQFKKLKSFVEGGLTREDSVWNAFGKISPESEIVLVHDAARPLIQPSLIQKVIALLKSCDAVIPGLKIKSTLKEVDEKGYILKTHDRERLWEAQTPQGFRKEILRKAFERAGKNRAKATDEACLLEWMKVPVKVIEGDERNIKITTREDLKQAEFLLRTV